MICRASARLPNRCSFKHSSRKRLLKEGRLVARNVVAALYRSDKKKFESQTLGQLAAIGRRSGVANILGLNFSGFLAWWLWRTIYLSKLPRLEKKIRAALDWTLDLLFTKDFARVTPPR
jgi:NADH dehydrogenase